MMIEPKTHPFIVENLPMREWQATNARAAFAEIIDAAAAGNPQLIHRRDGKQIVVVSRDYFEAHKPNLRDYLLTSGYADEHDEFDEAMQKVQESGSAFLTTRAVKF